MSDNRSKGPMPGVMDVATFLRRFGEDRACWTHLRNARWGANLERFVSGECGRDQGWWGACRAVAKAGYDYRSVIIGSGRHAAQTLPWIHTFIGNMKRMVRGTHHWVSPEHVDDYFAEFAYRANRH